MVLQAQNDKSEQESNSRNYENSFNPDLEETTFKSERAKRRYRKLYEKYDHTYDQLIEEYEQRMKAVAKQKKKEAKMAQKPQYSDPLYFGHKRKPKIRPVGKRKFCKECGIVH
jgi:flavin-dependent dehydrogenase